MKRCHWINQNGVQCGQPSGHLHGHGNGLLTSPRDDWHEYIGPSTIAVPVGVVEKSGTVHTDKSTTPRCLWMGPLGRCIYEQGHTIGHREETVLK